MIRINIESEGVSVVATCPRCECPLERAGGSVSWRCDSYGCGVRIIPMFEDARFVEDSGREWIITEEGEWIDVVDDSEGDRR